jgi:putative ABC transport system ATP-binding protein
MIIEAHNLSKVYKLPYEEITALDGISFNIEAGEFVAIMGPSGAGKTTLLNLIGALDTPTSGRLCVAGYNLCNCKEKDMLSIRRKHIGFVFEEFLLLSSLTAEENVELPLYFLKQKSGDIPREVLENVGLGKRKRHLPCELSGGELQRVSIARALVTSPDIILADEPTGNLDTKNAQNIFALFKRFNEEDRKTIIVATHNVKLAYCAKRIIHLLDGRIIKDERISG